MDLGDLRPPRDLPAGDARIPALALRALLLVCGVALTLVVARGDAWIVPGVLLSLGAALAPAYLLAWILIVVLAVAELSHHVSLGWRPLVLLAGVHLLHCLGLLSQQLPWRSWIQPAVLIAPLRRFLVIQIPAQIVALIALGVLGTGSEAHRNHVPVLALLGAVALLGLGWLLLGVGDEEVG